MADRVGQGGTIRRDSVYTDGAGNLVDPASPRVDILRPDGSQEVVDAVPVRISEGRYYYDFVVPALAPTGVWTDHWTGSVNGVAVEADDLFVVESAGSISFEETAIVTPEEVGIKMNRFLSEDEREVALMTIAEAQDEIETYLGRPVTVRTFEETIWASEDGSAYFRNTPVRSIEEVRIDGVATLDYVGTSYGLEGWPGPAVVRYTAGLDRPQAVRGLIFDAIKEALDRRSNSKGPIRQVEVEDYRVTYGTTSSSDGQGDNAPLGHFTRGQLKILHRLKRKF